jgi:hypothetical protein
VVIERPDLVAMDAEQRRAAVETLSRLIARLMSDPDFQVTIRPPDPASPDSEEWRPGDPG